MAQASHRTVLENFPHTALPLNSREYLKNKCTYSVEVVEIKKAGNDPAFFKELIK